MVGMIFAAGFGTRLKSWTDEHPKALVPVGGVPALARVIEKMRKAGMSRVIVNTHHFAEQIADFIKKGGYGSFVEISHEPIILETGGGLRKALPLIGNETVVVHNSDIMTDVPLGEMILAHERAGNDAALLTSIRRTSRFMIFSKANRLCGYYRAEGERILPDEIPAEFLPDGAYGRSFNGVHVLSPSIYPALKAYAEDNCPFSIIDFYRSVAAEKQIGHYDIPAECSWFDVGNPATLAAADNYYSTH